jgi:copper homeostasis protein
MSILIEVCVESPAGLAAAIAGGAGRVELCSALALQGMTPSPGLMALAAAAPIPVYPMLRPRPGDFCYDAVELDVLKRDIDAVRAYGLKGVAIGANRPSGALDSAALEALATHAQGLDLTLHRAFDLTPDLTEALETAIALGFSRVLTSGGAISALDGVETIAGLVERARGRIGILAGAGVRPGNIADLVARTGVSEVHGSFGGPAPRGADGGAEGRGWAMGFVDRDLRDTNREAVAAAVTALKGL